MEGSMKLEDNSTLNKLILLYVFEEMDVPVTQGTITLMCTSLNTWLPYMDCIVILNALKDSGFIMEFSHDKEPFFSITADGRSCLNNFYTRIPSTLRNEISEYIKETRMTYKRKQEYHHKYHKNPDGTYSVHLSISDPIQTTLELKLNVSNRSIAKHITNNWEKKASQIYMRIHEDLID